MEVNHYFITIIAFPFLLLLYYNIFINTFTSTFNYFLAENLDIPRYTSIYYLVDIPIFRRVLPP